MEHTVDARREVKRPSANASVLGLAVGLVLVFCAESGCRRGRAGRRAHPIELHATQSIYLEGAAGALRVGDVVPITVEVSGWPRSPENSRQLRFNQPWVRPGTLPQLMELPPKPGVRFWLEAIVAPQEWPENLRQHASITRGALYDRLFTLPRLRASGRERILASTQGEGVSVEFADEVSREGVFLEDAAYVLRTRAAPVASPTADLRLALVETQEGIVLYGEAVLPLAVHTVGPLERYHRRHEIVWRPQTHPRPVRAAIAVNYDADWFLESWFDVYRGAWAAEACADARGEIRGEEAGGHGG